jgi:dienelactone hydrolase
MAVLPGEGRVPILFGTWALPLPPNRSAYIARPGVGGVHPTVVIGHDGPSVSSGVKAIAQHLARYGYSVMVPHLDPPESDLESSAAKLRAGVASARVPGTPWASDADIAVLGIGSGGLAAAVVAIETETPVLVLAGTPLDEALLTRYDGALLVLHGTGDTPADELRGLHESVGRGEWVIYDGVGAAFIDDRADGFEPISAADALERVVAALDKRFGMSG